MSLGGLQETKHICQLANLITNSKLSKLFIEHILMNVLINVDVWRWIFLEFSTASRITAFVSSGIISMSTKNFLTEENIHFFIQNVRRIQSNI